MPRWSIRVKLLAGLTLVVGMMATLLAGSIFGLRSFHRTNLTLTNQLRELGASKDLLQDVMQLDLDDEVLDDLLAPGPGGGARGDARPPGRLLTQLGRARDRLSRYYRELERNSLRGNRSDGRDEFALAFLIDDDLAGLLELLAPGVEDGHRIARTPVYLARHPEHDLLRDGPRDPMSLARSRLRRLTSSALELPDALHSDFYLVLEASKRQYQSSRVIVWTAALAVLTMMLGLTRLVRRWVLAPIRVLHRGVRRVAGGSFDEPIRLDTGDEMQALAEAFNDMTERLGVIYADLERQVAERSRQLVRSERLAGVGFLAAGVAHEINNPLASVAFCAEALEGRVAPALEAADPGGSGDSRVCRDYLRMIQEEAFRCKRITERLLDFSRCGEIRRCRVDLVELIGSVVEMIQHMGKYRSKRIAFAPREAVVAFADAQEIKQVVLNLVVNALDSMGPGGTLRIAARIGGGMAEMTFRDEGCGMSPEVLENIFEPFFTRRQGGQGTGLGLSITHRIVCQHDGQIAATSAGEGLGSTFVVRLPTRPAAGPAPPRHGNCTPVGADDRGGHARPAPLEHTPGGDDSCALPSHSDAA